eukprot:CAMPEP_0182498398 /NCGR_PEP_ID=MMETSP1321-20130603/6600_1 /TAXON_ID=91990 /ORGANISM="Bolidomonas sp., Strain RCC1657" /LENGTH=234 /DNA_ID=CAMNT_0024702445 /DNA_START=181 /DNA_END=882 /DNA_ORIENTATION=-
MLIVEEIARIKVRVDVPVHVVDWFFVTVCLTYPYNAVHKFYNILGALLAIVLYVNYGTALCDQSRHPLEHVQLHALDVNFHKSRTGREQRQHVVEAYLFRRLVRTAALPVGLVQQTDASEVAGGGVIYLGNYNVARDVAQRLLVYERVVELVQGDVRRKKLVKLSLGLERNQRTLGPDHLRQGHAKGPNVRSYVYDDIPGPHDLAEQDNLALAPFPVQVQGPANEGVLFSKIVR